MIQILWVGLGGFVGATLRYGTTLLAARWMPPPAFPLGTFFVNVVGCFAIGLLAGTEVLKLSPHLRVAVVVGLLGGFTTFSAFGMETIALLRDGAVAKATLNVLGQVLLGLGAVYLGMQAARG